MADKAHRLTDEKLEEMEKRHHAAIGTNINMVDGCFSGDSIVQGWYIIKC